MTTKVGRFSVKKTSPKRSPTKSEMNKIINNAKKREETRTLPTWLERVFGYNTPQSEKVRNKLVNQSEILGKLKTQEILKQIEENKELRKITNKIKATKSKEEAKKLLKKWIDIVKTKKQLRTITTRIKTKRTINKTRNTGTQWKTTTKPRTARRTSETIKKKMKNALNGFGKNTARSTVAGYSRRTKKIIRKN
jgi:hypothetical protein